MLDQIDNTTKTAIAAGTFVVAAVLLWFFWDSGPSDLRDWRCDSCSKNFVSAPSSPPGSPAEADCPSCKAKTKTQVFYAKCEQCQAVGEIYSFRSGVGGPGRDEFKTPSAAGWTPALNGAKCPSCGNTDFGKLLPVPPGSAAK